jgi:hypothetical protein
VVLLAAIGNRTLKRPTGDDTLGYTTFARKPAASDVVADR